MSVGTKEQLYITRAFGAVDRLRQRQENRRNFLALIQPVTVSDLLHQVPVEDRMVRFKLAELDRTPRMSDREITEAMNEINRRGLLSKVYPQALTEIHAQRVGFLDEFKEIGIHPENIESFYKTVNNLEIDWWGRHPYLRELKLSGLFDPSDLSINVNGRVPREREMLEHLARHGKFPEKAAIVKHEYINYINNTFSQEITEDDGIEFDEAHARLSEWESFGDLPPEQVIAAIAPAKDSDGTYVYGHGQVVDVGKITYAVFAIRRMMALGMGHLQIAQITAQRGRWSTGKNQYPDIEDTIDGMQRVYSLDDHLMQQQIASRRRLHEIASLYAQQIVQAKMQDALAKAT